MSRSPLGKGAPVVKISLPYIYKLATDLEPISRIKAGDKLNDVFFTLITGQYAINTLLNGSVFAPALRNSRQSADALLGEIKHLTEGGDNLNRELNQFEIFGITNHFEQFKIALLAEFGVFPSYFVTQKGGFDTLTLLEWGQLVFPNDLHDKVPEATFDVQQTAKALAYELPTSAGFHTFRATESVLRRYYSHVTNGNPIPKVRNIGVYIRALRNANCGDEIILSSLEQLTKLHRNPLIHPEVALNLEEAISTVGMARSVVSAMLKVLPSLPPTTSTA